MSGQATGLLATPDRRRSHGEELRAELLENVVPFWFPRSVDRQYGGFLHCLDRDGALLDSDKSVWAQGRMSWMLLTLYATVEQRPEWRQWGRAGLDFLDGSCMGPDGRMLFQVTRDGRPIRQRRYAYSEAFAAIAQAAWYRVSGEQAAASRARELFDHFVRWNFTPGLMPAKYTDVRPMIGLGPRMITIVTAQELRAAMGPDPILEFWIDRCIDEIRRLFVKPELAVVMESVGPDGTIEDHFDGRLLNPGHAIEGAWFIMHEGHLRRDPALIRLGCQMLDWMWARGWDDSHGGIFYFRDVYDRPVAEYWQDMKFWWPHDEALIATLYAYLLTGDAKYDAWYSQLRRWSQAHFADPLHGEWYGYLHRDGTASTMMKGNMWKSAFHHPRMLHTCASLLGASDGVVAGWRL